MTKISLSRSFTLQSASGNTSVYAHSIVVRNAGRKPALNVRLGHHYLPSFELSPSINCEVLQLTKGGNEILFPTLVPDEQVTISYLYFPPITWNLIHSYVKSDEGIAKKVTVLQTEQYPRWVQLALRALLIIGVITIVYLAYVVGQKIVVFWSGAT